MRSDVLLEEAAQPEEVALVADADAAALEQRQRVQRAHGGVRYSCQTR